MPLITLTTDFGLADWFVGTMKGVMAQIAPKTKVIDLTHQVPAGDIRAGAFALAAACGYFPKGTVHVAVVDPGVGSPRKALAVATTRAVFIGPDNGVLSWALAKEQVKDIRLLENGKYFLQPISRTFHGRDIFAPVAAHLSSGLPLQKLGPAQDDYVRLDWPEPRRRRTEVQGEVVYIDRFGNALTNIEAGLLAFPQGPRQVFRGRKRLCPVAEFYQAVPAGQAVAVPGSSGFLEIAIHGGSAAEKLGLRAGSRIALRRG